jgi:hypothetical protein
MNKGIVVAGLLAEPDRILAERIFEALRRAWSADRRPDIVSTIDWPTA